MRNPKQPSDNDLQGHAALLVRRMMEGAVSIGHDAENVWLILALAADAMERALLYAGGAMGQIGGQQASAEYAGYKARLERLLAKAKIDYDAVAETTDNVLQIKRGAPQ